MNGSKLIYLDNQATTQTDPNVVEKMLPYFTKFMGNPSSDHSFGIEARSAVSWTRDIITKAWDLDCRQLVFTAGASESINLALKGFAASPSSKARKKIITTNIEHSATIETLKRLEMAGFEIINLPVDNEGLISTKQLESSLSEDTLLVSIILVNNEIGTVQDYNEIIKICSARQIPLHFDATQGIGKIEFYSAVSKCMSPLLFSFSSHKFYGPKGVGGLYLNQPAIDAKLVPLIDGGGQEGGLRAGTENVPGIVGMGRAITLCREYFPEETERITFLRDKFLHNLNDAGIKYSINGSRISRIPHNLNIMFHEVPSAVLKNRNKDIAFSTGSACSSSLHKPSHVLKAIGLNNKEASNSVRIGIGRFNTEEEINYCTDKFIEVINDLLG